MGTSSKNNSMGRLNGMAAGLRKHLMGQVLSINNTEVKVDDLLTEFDSYETQVSTTAVARSAWMQQVGAEQALVLRMKPELVSLEQYLRGRYGQSNAILRDFGLTPRTPPKVKVPVKAAAIVKSAETRVARHTMGKRQKAAIHGTPAAPTEPATPPAPQTGGTAAKPSS